MTTPAQQAEADRVEEAYRWAVAAVGVSVVQDSLALWAGAPVTATSYGSWLKSASKIISLHGRWLRELALAYYRLVRALRTGRSFPTQDDPAPTLESLREDLDRVLDEVATHKGKSPRPSIPARPSAADDDPLPLDDAPDIDAITKAVEEEVRSQVEAVLPSVGPQAMGRKEDRRDTTRPAEEVDGERNADRATAGRRTSAEAERITKLFARGTVSELAKADALAMGWVRYSKTGTPCGWCAMLLTRGFIPGKTGAWMYKTRANASAKQDDSRYKEGQEVGEQFHANCNCVAVPIFLESQLDSPLFDLNRELAKAWPEAVREAGRNGEDVLTVWRRYVREHYSQNPKAAPEAA